MMRSTIVLSLAALAFLVACGDDGKKSVQPCDTDAECTNGVCFDHECFTSCLDQDQCSPDQFCVTKTSGDREADVCVTASEFAGCSTDADCAVLVAGPCHEPRCEIDKALCYVDVVADGTACADAEQRAGACAAGECKVDTSCTPLGAIDEQCDGVDDDCDGGTDDDYVVTEVTCGIGACQVPGQKVCEAGSEVTQCAPGLPPADNDAECNGVDDDCDGETDEDYVIDLEITPTCGTGWCEHRGELVCEDGEIRIQCEPLAGPDGEQGDDSCDGVDGDCDGETDEEYVSVETACGQGACEATGTTTCVEGHEVDSCVPGQPAEADATCDGVDDDCDGTADEEFTNVPSQCGVGACASEGEVTCVEGQPFDSCQALDPTTSTDDDCDLVDDDCDGTPDDDLAVELPDGTVVWGSQQPCGVGACAGGVTECLDWDGEILLVCSTADPFGDNALEVCNGVDDDCDGQTDAADPDLLQDPSRACELYAGLCQGALRPVDHCQGGAWAPCTAADYLASDPLYQPGVETGCDGYDNDCDGLADEDFSYTGPDGVTVTGPGLDCGTGACAGGVTECGEGELKCSTQFDAAGEECDASDNDCDGQTDEAEDLPCGEGLFCVTSPRLEGSGCVQCWDDNDVRWDGCDFTTLAEVQVNEATALYEHRPAVTSLAGGGFAVTWTSRNDQTMEQQVFARRFGADGLPTTGELQVSPAGGTALHRFSRLAPTPDGGFVVLWGNQYTELLWRAYDGQAQPLGEAASLAPVTSGLSSWDLGGDSTSGRLVAVWDLVSPTSGLSTINGQGFGQGAVTAWGPQIVGEPSPATSETGPRVAVFPDGHAVAAWHGGDGNVRVRLLGADGTPAETIVDLVPEATGGIVGYTAPVPAAWADGSFVVVYVTMENGQTVVSVDAQRFGADGKPVGDPVRVDSLGYDGLSTPEVAALSDGGFVVAFPGTPIESPWGSEAYARWFGADDVPLGPEAPVHTWLSGDQSMVRVAALSDGAAVVAWASCEIVGAAYTAQDGAGCGVYQQRFDAHGGRLYR